MLAIRRLSGFTLVEVAAVLTLVGVVTAIALPRIQDARDQLTLDTAAQEFARDLSATKVEAIRLNRTRTVRTNLDTGYVLPTLEQRTFEHGIVLAQAAPDSVMFTPFGPPSTGAGTYQLSLGSRSRTIRISAAGFVSID
jgi:prepilin-type N-terminal cleavage/methylation domain-containing protein